jgi:uncharacterized protein involved in tolerance to divalent cations
MPDCKETDILSLTTTVASLDEAERLAALLVGQRVAACVQLDPEVRSHYRWQGQVACDAEVRLTVKTLPERLEAVQALLAAEHSYDLPQLAWQVQHASAAYAAWVREAVAPVSG